jgi:hypothetical protein
MTTQPAKDKWDKADIWLKPIGGLSTALAVVAAGYFTSQYLDSQQARETNVRLYAELMSNREQSESTLRKDMFQSIIASFVGKDAQSSPEQSIFNLELLAYNFHESLDLGPVFKHVYALVQDAGPDRSKVLMPRLERVANDVIAREAEALAEGPAKVDATVFLEELRNSPAGVLSIDRTLTLALAPEDESGQVNTRSRHFKLETLSYDKIKREFRVRLQIVTLAADGKPDSAETTFDSVFSVGYFDFPMIDNVRLSHGERCAIVLTKLQPSSDPVSAELTALYFPGSRASLREKRFYDEIIADALRTGRLLNEASASKGNVK